MYYQWWKRRQSEMWSVRFGTCVTFCLDGRDAGKWGCKPAWTGKLWETISAWAGPQTCVNVIVPNHKRTHVKSLVCGGQWNTIPTEILSLPPLQMGSGNSDTQVTRGSLRKGMVSIGVNKLSLTVLDTQYRINDTHCSRAFIFQTVSGYMCPEREGGGTSYG